MNIRHPLVNVAFLVILISGCNLIGYAPNARPAPQRQSNLQTLPIQSFFQQEIGTSWVYEGFAEYGHRMVLTSSKRAAWRNRRVKEISGNVADMSDGESLRDFSFKLRYILTPNAVQEEIVSADTPFPHTIPKLTILKRPLRKGARWRQTVKIQGKKAVLRAEILDLQTDPSHRIRVRYRVPMEGMPDGVYEEIREFSPDMGIYRLEKTFGPNASDRFNYEFRALIKPARYRDAIHQATFLYPRDWQKTAEHRYEGFGGFFRVSALTGPKSVEEAAQNEISHGLRPYGSNPTVKRWTIQKREARLILPSTDQAREMHRQAALVLRYPRRLQIGEELYDYLLIHADSEHIPLIANSLQFL